MNLERASGILLHPTSFPNGVLDEHAYGFVDWLAAAGQRWWQVLPLGPPEGLTKSPYMSPSAFAGSPALLAKPRAAVSRGEVEAFRARNAYWVDDWHSFGGSVEDQVRFDREWGALRAYAAGRGGRRASGSLREDRPALGQPAVRLVGDAGRPLPLVDRAVPACIRAGRPDTGRPLPRLRLVLGRAEGQQDGAPRQVAARARRG